MSHYSVGHRGTRRPTTGGAARGESRVERVRRRCGLARTLSVVTVALVSGQAACSSKGESASAVFPSVALSLPAGTQETAVRGLRAGNASVRERLRSVTRVPVRLPTVLHGSPREDSLYVLVADAAAEHYFVVYAFGRSCDGGSACTYASVAAERVTAETERDKGRRVTLRPGLTGRFVPSECGANCTGDEVSWREGRYGYGVGLKGGTLADLLKMARSALPRDR